MRRVLILITEIRSKFRKHSLAEKPQQNLDSADDHNDQNHYDDVRDTEASCSVYFTSPLSTLISIPSAKGRSSVSWMSTSLIAEWTTADARDNAQTDASGKQHPFAWIPSFYEYDADDNGVYQSQEQFSLHELFLSQEICRINAEREYINDMLSCNKTAPYHRRVVRYNTNDSAYYYRPEYGGKLDDICHSSLLFTAFVVGLESILSVETDIVLAMKNVPKNVKRKYRARASNNLHKRRPRTRLRFTKKLSETSDPAHSDLLLRVRTELATISPPNMHVLNRFSGTDSQSGNLGRSVANSENKGTTDERGERHMEQKQRTVGVASLVPNGSNCQVTRARQPNANCGWSSKVLGWTEYLESRLHKLVQRKSAKSHEHRWDTSRSQMISSSLAVSSTAESHRAGLRLSEENKSSVRSTNSRATARTRNFMMAIRQLPVSEDPYFNCVAHRSGSFFTSTPISRSFDD